MNSINLKTFLGFAKNSEILFKIQPTFQDFEKSF